MQRLTKSAGVIPILSSWISDCIEAGHIIGIGPSHCPPSPEPSVVQHRPQLSSSGAVQSNSQLSNPGSLHSNADESTATSTSSPSPPIAETSHSSTITQADHPDNAGAAPAGASEKHDSSSAATTAADQTVEEGESEVDELDPLTPSVSPLKKRRGKAYSNEDIGNMQRHYFEQMALTPRPPLTGIWESFAIMVSYL